MRWDSVIPACVVAPVVADTEALVVLGNPPTFFMAGEREFSVPSLRWTLIANTEGENYEDALVQLDFWVRSVAQAVALSRALRRLLHHEAEVTIGGLKLWSKYVESRPVRTARDGIVEGSLDFRLTYLRERFIAVA
jgi:hypothetical protein